MGTQYERFTAFLKKCSAAREASDDASLLCAAEAFDRVTQTGLHQLQLKELVSDLTAAVQAEGDANTRQSMHLSLDLLRDGYQLKLNADSSGELVVGYSRGIVGVHVDSETLEKKGAGVWVGVLFAEIRAEEERKWGDSRQRGR